MNKEIRVVTYNINNAKFGTNLEYIARFLKSLNADIIAIQECDKNCSRSLNTDMALRIAYVTEMEYRFFPTIGMKDWYWKHTGFYGLAIFTKHHIIGENCVDLFSDNLEKRILCSAEIDIEGDKLTFYNTHLTYEDKNIRTKQLKQINSSINKQENFILSGDFNVDSNDEFKIIDNCDYINTNYYDFETCSDDDFKKIDNIYFSNKIEKINCYTEGDKLSDHSALIADFNLIKRSRYE